MGSILEIRRKWLHECPGTEYLIKEYHRIFDAATGDPNEIQREAGEKLALLYLQTGRSEKADEILVRLRYSCRLAGIIINYPEETLAHGPPTYTGQLPPARVFDDFLSPAELEVLKRVFCDRESSYWKDNGYSVEPPSPYYSFIIPMAEIESFGIIGNIIGKFQEYLESPCNYVELWAHNRPHCTGHQLHFDTDNEGLNGVVKNPEMSSVLYLSGQDERGAPTIVTNQRLSSRRLATDAWLCYPKQNRVAMFGRVLHGVLPGKCQDTSRSPQQEKPRVTVMLAFWRKIHIRTYPKGKVGGAAQAFPRHSEFGKIMTSAPLPGNDMNTKPKEVQPIHIKGVYESTENGKLWTPSMGMPGYEDMFQGF